MGNDGVVEAKEAKAEVSASPFNPYVRRPEDVREPPTNFLGTLKHLGPGLIVVGSIVGSGELITTTALGAQIGFACLWLLMLSCLTKTIMMEELARFTISSGETCLEAFNKLPGPKGRVGWFIYLWLAFTLPGIITASGIIGGVGQVMDIAFPLSPWGSLTGDKQWAVLMAVITITLILTGRYSFIQAACTFMVISFTIATIICAIALQWTPYAVSWSDIAEGFKFQLPSGAMVLALGAYGGTGATPGESMAYTYWCLEKGYARFAGEPDGTDSWLRRARGWLKVMHADVINIMFIFTVATVAFYFLGAAVLHPLVAEGVIEPPEGRQTVEILSKTFTKTLGEWAKWLYLVGGFFVLYSTVFSGWASGGRFWADMLGVVGLIDTSDYRKRLLWIRVFCFALPIITTLSYVFIGKVVILLAIGGTISALMTPVVALGTLYLRCKRTDRRIAPTWKGDVLLWVGCALMVAVTPYALWAERGRLLEAWQAVTSLLGRL